MRSFAMLVVALVIVSACGKKKEPGRTQRLSLTRETSAPAPTDALSGRPAPPPTQPRERMPVWTRERPRFFDRGGRRFASAVGSARVGNLALARTTAQDRARADLLQLIEAIAPGEVISGTLRGARMTDAFTTKGGEVFVRVEVEQTLGGVVRTAPRITPH